MVLNKFIKKKFHYYFEKIKPGLDKGKCLINDGLINLNEKELSIVYYEKYYSFMSLLSYNINSYPICTVNIEYINKNKCTNMLCLFFDLLKLVKLGHIEIEYGLNKLDPNHSFNIKYHKTNICDFVNEVPDSNSLTFDL